MMSTDPTVVRRITRLINAHQRRVRARKHVGGGALFIATDGTTYLWGDHGLDWGSSMPQPHHRWHLNRGDEPTTEREVRDWIEGQ